MTITFCSKVFSEATLDSILFENLISEFFPSNLSLDLHAFFDNLGQLGIVRYCLPLELFVFHHFCSGGRELFDFATRFPQKDAFLLVSHEFGEQFAFNRIFKVCDTLGLKQGSKFVARIGSTSELTQVDF